MKISFIKYEKEESYFLPKLLGMDITEIKKPEQIDKKIEELRNQNYTTIVLSNELASFSENVVSKYKYDQNFKIIITPTKNSHK